MANKDTTTYIFLASRRYPLTNNDFEYEFKDDGTHELAKKKGQQIVALDITTSFSTSWDGDLSKYPVSGGSEVSDHLSIRNNKYTLQGMVSDTPIEIHKNEYYGDGGTGADRVMAAIEMLETMFKNKVTFTLFSEYQKIDNAIITGIKFDQEAQSSISFTIEMEQVRFAYAKNVTLNVSTAVQKKTATNTNSGTSAKQQADSQSAYRDKVAENKRINLQNQ